MVGPRLLMEEQDGFLDPGEPGEPDPHGQLEPGTVSGSIAMPIKLPTAVSPAGTRHSPGIEQPVKPEGLCAGL